MLPGALKQNNKLESTKKLRDVHIFSIHYTAKGCATYTGCRLIVPIFDLYVTCSLHENAKVKLNSFNACVTYTIN